MSLLSRTSSALRLAIPRLAIPRLIAPCRDRWRAGGVAVEGALLAPIIITMVAGVADYGFSVQDKMRLVGAVRAGAQYALIDSNDLAAVRQTVVDALDVVDSSGAYDDVAVTVSPSCECPGAGAADCGETCAEGTMIRRVTVVAERPYQWMMDYPAIANPTTLHAEATVRVQ